MKKLLFLALVLLLIPSVGLAAISDDNVYVGPTETIDDNFVRAGNTITIDGLVNGDVVVIGNTVTINGKVRGDVIAFGATVTINGSVDGNIRAAGGTLSINGSAEKNITVAGGTLSTGKDSVAGWSFAAAGGTMHLEGQVKGNLTAYGGAVTLGNTVGTNATIFVDPNGSVTLLPATAIAGDLTYTSSNAADIQEGAIVDGQTIHRLPSQTAGRAQEFLDISWIFAKLIGLFAILFVGVIIVSLLPDWVTRTVELMKARPGMSILVGLITFIVTPIVAVILLFSIIGIPLALILSALYFMFLYCAKVFLGAFIGMWIVKHIRKQAVPGKEPSLFWPMMLGTTIVVAISAIPILGWIVEAVGAVWAFGALCITLRQGMAARG